MRCNAKLERTGLFRKIRHGGKGNRNKYEPIWPRFREYENSWQSKMKKGTAFGATALSPATGLNCHLQGDNPVTQTCSRNLHKSTCESELPNKRRISSMAFVASKPIGKRSTDAAHDEAERRWTTQLGEQFRSLPVTYGEIIDAITEELREAATRAELRSRGAGFRYIVQQLKLR
jgi:hypothetical protein